MRKNELVYYYALDRKWMSTEQANLLLKRAEEEGLLGIENGLYSPRFDIAALTLPVGFKPTSGIFERHDPVQDLIARIARARSLEETDVVAEMNRIIKDNFDMTSSRPLHWSCLRKTAGFSSMTFWMRSKVQQKSERCGFLT